MSNAISTTSSAGSPSAIKTILLAGFIAGTLDILAAITVYAFIMHRTTAKNLLQGIARSVIGVFGERPTGDSLTLTLAGLGFHFMIAFSFAIFYFLVFPYLPSLKKKRILSGLLYGIFVWCVMNLAMLPLFHIANIPHKWDNILRGMIILMLCIGLPVSLIVSRYYNSKNQL